VKLACSTSVVIMKKRPSCSRIVGAQIPAELGTPRRSSWLVRVRQWPTCRQFTRSVLWKSGTPGKYSNELVTR